MKIIIHFLLSKSSLILTTSILFFAISLFRYLHRSQYELQWSPVQFENLGSRVEIRTIEDLTSSSLLLANKKTVIKVYTGLYSHFYDQQQYSKSLSNRLGQLLSVTSSLSSKLGVEYIPMNLEQQLTFLKEFGHLCYQPNIENDIKNDTNKHNSHHQLLINTFETMISQEHTKPLAQELWKFCVMNWNLQNIIEEEDNKRTDNDMVAYIDLESPLLDEFDSILKQTILRVDNENKVSSNIAVLGDAFSASQRVNEDDKFKTIHGSFLMLQRNHQSTKLAQDMIDHIVKSFNNDKQVIYDSLYIARQLYHLIIRSRDEFNNEWIFLQQRCHSDPFQNHVTWQQEILQQQQHNRKMSTKNPYLNPIQTVMSCASNHIYCCDIVAPNGKAVMVTRHILLPYQLIPQQATENVSKKKFLSHEAHFTTMIHERIVGDSQMQQKVLTPNKRPKTFIDFVMDKKCMPPDKSLCKHCFKYINSLNGGRCEICAKYCSCFCDVLCNVNVEEKEVGKVVTGILPKYKRDPTRRIPRIIHQTWYEPVTREAYPNFSRLTESWKQQSGWEYRFYSDDDAAKFLAAHFPAEVKEAYDALIPGAFKADLFRYCVLFIYGGVYADIDVMLTSKLEMAIDDDVGFMVPLDKTPGEKSGSIMCLWNGLLLSQPGHPILAKVIETTVNNIRNRFTNLDVMNTFCPNVDTSITTNYGLLFITGPCILGATLNRILGRHPQNSFQVGDVDTLSNDVLNKHGRVVILDGNKEDMGAFRFTHNEKNIIIATTDMPDFDDRPVDHKNVPSNHYSKVKDPGIAYGREGLYRNKKIAHESIRFEIA